MTASRYSLSIFLLCAAVLLPGVPVHAQPATAKGCAYQLLATLPVRYTGPSLSLTIEGMINGTPADMLVDTGAEASMLTRTATERRGLRLSPTGLRMIGIGGEASVYTTRVREFRAGPALLANSRVRVLGDHGTAPSFDAILSAQFLLQGDFEIALKDKEIRFFKPSNCKTAVLSYWDPDAVVIPFALSFSGSINPQFKVTINRKELTAMIDSGASTTILTRRAAHKVGLRVDAPGVERLPDIGGIGRDFAARWHATLPTLQIGRETIENAEVGVVDTDDLDIDLLLGADFLRSHRVLFAMSQRKLYFSYVGGEPLGQRRRIEPWLQQEADAGNGDAQMMVAHMYAAGQGTPRDPAQANAWIDKAAAGGHPHANLLAGERLLGAGRPAEAAARFRAALDRLPGERLGALWLYRARMRTGDAALARRELAAAFTHDTDEWPGPVADYYLGKIDQDQLLARARSDQEWADARTCDAWLYIAEGHRMAGDEARAGAVLEAVPACRARPRTQSETVSEAQPKAAT